MASLPPRVSVHGRSAHNGVGTPAGHPPPFELVAIVFVVTVAAVLGGLAWRRPQWAMRILQPELPGGIGALIGVLMAIWPDAVKTYQVVSLTLVFPCFAWFLWSYIVSTNREFKRIRLRLSREAMRLSFDISQVMDPCKVLYYEMKSHRPGVVQAANQKYPAALEAMQRTYYRDFRFRVSDFFEELAENGFRQPSEVVELAFRIDTGPSTIEVPALERLYEHLWLNVAERLRK